MKGRILDSAGRPVPGLTLLPEDFARAPGQRGFAGTDGHPRPLITDKDGRFIFHGVHSGNAFHLKVLLGMDRATELGMQCDPGRAMAPVLWLAAEKMAGRKVADGKVEQVMVREVLEGVYGKKLRYASWPVPGGGERPVVLPWR